MTTSPVPPRIGRSDIVLALVVVVMSVSSFVVLSLGPLPAAVQELEAAGGTWEQMSVASRVGASSVLVIQGLLLVLRRSRPLLCLVAVAASQVVVSAMLAMSISSELHLQTTAMIVAAYSMGVWARERTALIATAATGLAETVVSLALTSHGLVLGAAAWAQIASAVVSYVSAALVGIFVRTRRQQNEMMRERVQHAEREREAHAAQTVLEERGRIARELHDVAAHHLSGIVVQATAAERLLDTDPDRAREAMRYVQNQGRETLDSLRLVVGILRASGDEAESTPQPNLAGVDVLLDEARQSGAVHHRRSGEPRPMTPTEELTVYRVLQESLANARRHAPGRRVEVEETFGDRSYRLRIGNAAPLPSPAPSSGGTGYGLVGMRERAALVGGTLDAGPTGDGGWSVLLSIPVHADAIPEE